MASLDHIVKDDEGFVRVSHYGGTVLFRVVRGDRGGLIVHLRLKRNCNQVQERGSPDYYIPLEDFVTVITS